ncbi:DNA polymerase [Rhodobacter phage RcThunderbird]|nr:DNA polymerase [Rhodobacter phage RcThunderbird]
MLKIDQNGNVLPKGQKDDGPLTRGAIEMRPVEYMTDAELAETPTGSVFVYDIECYRNFFYIAFKCIKTNKVVDFEISPDCNMNRDKLRFMLWRYCFVGFNSKKYDIYMLLRALNDPFVTNEQLKDMSDDIIKNELFGFAVEKKYKIDVPNVNHIDLIEVAPLSASLKTYGGRLHCERMQDLPFPEWQLLTQEEAQFVKNYCANDLDVTALMLFELREQLSLRDEMSKEYNIDLRSKSDAQVAEAVIGKEIAKLAGAYPRKPTIHADSMFRYHVPDYVKFKTPELQAAVEAIGAAYFKLGATGEPLWPDGLGVQERNKSGKLVWTIKIKIGDTTYKMGMGGLHSQEKSVCHIATPDVIISDHDVESYYPRIILNQGLYPSHLGPAFLQVYETLVNRRVAAKRSGDKITADSLKITINGSFGKLGSKYSILYAPDLLLQTTISGQLTLLMFIEKFEMNGIPVISANTDGIVVKARKDQIALRDALIKEFEAETRFVTEETRYLAVYSRDINNYIAVKQKQEKETKAWLNEPDGCKFKGAYSNPWADPKSAIFRFHKNPEVTICIEAAAAYLTKGTPIEETITNDRDIRKFVKVRNVKGGGQKDGVYLGKVVRWYYAEGDMTAIHYVGSGNKVPTSEGGSPIMDIPKNFPNDVNFNWYIKETAKILTEIGCFAKRESASLF